jgi:hypothetical protein
MLRRSRILSGHFPWTDLEEGLKSFHAFCSEVAEWNPSPETGNNDKNFVLLIWSYHGGQLLTLFLFLGCYIQQQLTSEFFKTFQHPLNPYLQYCLWLIVTHSTLNNPSYGYRYQKKNSTFWEELIAYFPLIQHGPHRKRRLQQFFVAAGMYVPTCYTKSKSKLLHDWQFTAHQFISVPNPLRMKTRLFFNWTLAVTILT